MCRMLDCIPSPQSPPHFVERGRKCDSVFAALFMGALIILLSGCNLQSGTPTPIPTPNIPSVEFQFPQNNSTVVEGVDLDIDVVATDPGTGVARVELLVDDQPHLEGKPEISPEVPTFTVKMNWLAQGIGAHSLTAVAYRLDGTASAPKTIIVEVVARE
jgi:hypothetical protein